MEVEGSVTHRLLCPGGGWKRLDEIGVGDRVIVSPGSNLWSSEFLPISWKPRTFLTKDQIAETIGVSSHTVYRYLKGNRTTVDDLLAPLVLQYRAQGKPRSVLMKKRIATRIPERVDEKLGTFLGYLTGDGHISAVKRTIGLTTADEPQADDFARLVEDLFGLIPVRRWTGTKWRIRFSSQTIQEFLQHLGLPTGFCAREKTVPDVILRSPKEVVAAFLRALYDCDGYAGKQGVILSTSSTEMSKTVQLLLLNFGILSTRRPHKDGCWHVHTLGRSCAVFQKEIGFGLTRKQEALRGYLDSHRWFKEECWEDEVVSIERGRADVYDISVEETHRYAAQGFINHNSYWHTTIMTQKALLPSELIDYADHHSGTVAMQRGRINPYKLGLELLRDIEHRWDTGKFGKEYDDCDDVEARRKWDKKLGLGRQKIFEVRRVHNDITFIDTFLTPEFCVEHKMFTFAFQEQGGNYVIESREFQKIKQRLLFSLTNFGKPWIYVVDGNYRNRGELLLRHEHNGLDLKLDAASDTLANVQYIWGRPVHLQTVIDDKPSLLSFDGSDHTIRTLGEADDPRKQSPGKAH
jgi:stage V sporulation protein R